MDMNTKTKTKTKTILTCVEGSAAPTPVADQAIWSAQRLDAPLEFLHVVDRHPERASSRDLSDSLGVDAQDFLMHERAAFDEQRSKLSTDHGCHLFEGIGRAARGVHAFCTAGEVASGTCASGIDGRHIHPMELRAVRVSARWKF